MSTDAHHSGAELGSFLDTVGRSFSDAQDTLGEGLGLPTSFVIADAELEIKAAVSLDAAGRTVVQTLSARDLYEGVIDPGVLSTVRVGFTATPREVAPEGPLQVERPNRQPNDVVQDLRSRPDVAALAKILGDLQIQATYVPGEKRWLVVARDPRGRLVRQVILPDQEREGDVE
jgi:hypothetical protein